MNSIYFVPFYQDHFFFLQQQHTLVIHSPAFIDIKEDNNHIAIHKQCEYTNEIFFFFMQL